MKSYIKNISNSNHENHNIRRSDIDIADNSTNNNDSILLNFHDESNICFTNIFKKMHDAIKRDDLTFVGIISVNWR